VELLGLTCWCVNQWQNTANRQAHYLYTAPEILQQVCLHGALQTAAVQGKASQQYYFVLRLDCSSMCIVVLL
jgi:hypothetical protein